MSIFRKRLVAAVLLTSIFWFIVNSLVLFSSQGGFFNNRKSRYDDKIGDIPLYSYKYNQQQSKKPVFGESYLTTNQNDVDKQTDLEQREAEVWFQNKLTKKPKFNKGKLTKSKVLSRIKTFQSTKDKAVTRRDKKENNEFTKIFERQDSNGPGENGQGVKIDETEKDLEKEGYSKHSFNQLASDKISLFRSIPDTRDPR